MTTEEQGTGSPDIADMRARSIVETATVILEEGGLEALTIRAMLARTGLARRAFYERFGGKDDLMLAVFAHAIRNAADRYERRLAEIADPLARLELVVTSIALGTLSPAADRARHGAVALSREHLRLAESRPDELAVAVRPLLLLLTRLLTEAAAGGVARSGPQERPATLIFNVASTTAHETLIGGGGTARDDADRKRIAADVWTFCRRAIAP